MNTARYWDNDDNEISLAKFKKQTGISPIPYSRKARSKHFMTIENSRDSHSVKIRKIQSLLGGYFGGNINGRIPEAEVLILETRDNEAANQYLKKLSKVDYPVDRTIINILLLALRYSSVAISYFKHPTEQMKEYAIKIHPNAIYYIKNPSEKLQLLAININPDAIKYIDNPTEKVIDYYEKNK